ncbi:MAG: mechanosensitive ion channel family protein [Planctomycetota bacterium]
MFARLTPTLLSIVLLLALAPGLAAQPELLPIPAPANAEQASNDESAEVPAAPEGLESPRDTFRTFLEAMHAASKFGLGGMFRDESAPALAALDLGANEDFNVPKRADHLHRVLNRIEKIDVNQLPGPDDPNVAAGEEFVYFPPPSHDIGHRLTDRTSQIVGALNLDSSSELAGRITLTRGDDGGWRFSTETVGDILSLFSELESLPPVSGLSDLSPDVTTVIESFLPDSLVANEVMGLKYWQWLLIALVIFIGLAIDLLVRGLLRLLAHRIAGKAYCENDEEGVRKTMRPIGLFAAGLFWLTLAQLVGFEGLALAIVKSSLAVFTTLAGTVSAWRLIDLIASFLIYRAARSKTQVDDVLVPLVRTTAKIFVVIVGVVWLAGVLDVLDKLWPLVASLGIGSVAFAFAAKDTVENFFGSVAVLLDRPFNVGDWVQIEGHEGIVEEIGFRSTRVRTFYNSQITIPNSNLVRAVVDNYGRRRYRRWRTMLGVQYDTPPETLAAFTEGIRELIRLHPWTRKDYYQVYCNEFGDFSLQILLYMFFEVPDWNTELRERDRLFRDIVRLADALGVQFAFPTQTVHLYKEEHHPPQRSHEDPESLTDTRASVHGIRAAKKITRNQGYVQSKPDPVVIQQAASEDGEVEELDAAGNPIERADDDDAPGDGAKPAPPRDDRPTDLKGGG